MPPSAGKVRLQDGVRLSPSRVLVRAHVGTRGGPKAVEKTFYRGLKRRWKIAGGAVGPEWVATNGVLQGCAISVVLMNILIGIWALGLEQEMQEKHPW